MINMIARNQNPSVKHKREDVRLVVLPARNREMPISLFVNARQPRPAIVRTEDHDLGPKEHHPERVVDFHHFEKAADCPS